MNELISFALGGLATTAGTAFLKGFGENSANLINRLLKGTKEDALDCYIADIKASNLSSVEKALLIQEAPRRLRKLRNSHDICEKAFSMLNSPEKLQDNLKKIDEDKLHLILEESEKVSDKEIQTIWAFILKHTIEDGMVSKRLIGILSRVDAYEANVFGIICNYLMKFSITNFDGQLVPIGTGFYLGSGYLYGYKLDKIKRGDISRLVNAGLMQIQTDNYRYKTDDNLVVVDYFSKRITLTVTSQWLECSAFRLTFEGEELYNCILGEETGFDGHYFSFVKEELAKQGVNISETVCSNTERQIQYRHNNT